MNSTTKFSVKPENLQITPVSTYGVTKEGTATLFEVTGETLAECWECTEQMSTVSGTSESDQLMKDGGDATFLTHKGTELEADWAKDDSLADPPNTTNSELEGVWQLIGEMATKGELLTATINVNERMLEARSREHRAGIGPLLRCFERAVWGGRV